MRQILDIIIVPAKKAPKSKRFSKSGHLLPNAAEDTPAIRAQEYCGLWGNPKTTDGRLFYEANSTPRLFSNVQWENLAFAIIRQMEEVRKNPQHFDKNDEKELGRLYRWAIRNSQRK